MPVGSKGEIKVGVGFTVILKVFPIPKQPFACGTTVKFILSINTPVFIVLNEPILPFPDKKGNPNTVLLFVQLKVVLGVEEVKITGIVFPPLQIDCETTESNIGIGLITILKLMVFPLQLLDNGVTVKIVDIGTERLLVGVKDGILPIPVAGSPMEGLLLFHIYCVFATNEPVKIIGEDTELPQMIWLATVSIFGVGLTT
jgi:hypothetical protein